MTVKSPWNSDRLKKLLGVCVQVVQQHYLYVLDSKSTFQKQNCTELFCRLFIKNSKLEISKLFLGFLLIIYEKDFAVMNF